MRFKNQVASVCRDEQTRSNNGLYPILSRWSNTNWEWSPGQVAQSASEGSLANLQACAQSSLLDQDVKALQSLENSNKVAFPSDAPSLRWIDEPDGDSDDESPEPPNETAKFVFHLFLVKLLPYLLINVNQYTQLLSLTFVERTGYH